MLFRSFLQFLANVGGAILLQFLGIAVLYALFLIPKRIWDSRRKSKGSSRNFDGLGEYFMVFFACVSIGAFAGKKSSSFLPKYEYTIMGFFAFLGFVVGIWLYWRIFIKGK